MSDQLSLLQKHFDTALESPDGIKKLRELILTLAMQGKLVKQDPKDQPACELLQEIQAEKERLISNKKLKRGQLTEDSTTIFNASILPVNWKLAKAGEIFFITKLAGFEYTKHFNLLEYGDVPVIRAQNVRKLKLDLTNVLYIDLETSILLERCALSKPALLVTFIGAGIGDVALFTEKERWHLAPNVAKMELFDNCDYFIDLIYINYFLISEYGRREIFKHLKSTAQPSISMGTIRDIDIPLPPLAEQKRIVAKIDELMALCDKLEAQRNARNDKRLAVHTAAINRLLTAADKNDFDSAWQFITRHFDPLYSVKENVAELKKAILTLAMQGKLVKQDPKDQPASELLKEIRAEKERLIKEGKIKRQKELPPIKPEEVPYQMPDGWVWTRLGDVVLSITGGGTPSKNNSLFWDGTIPWASVKDLNVDVFISDTIDHITEDAIQSSSTNLIPKNRVIVCTRMGLGKIAINTVEMAINQDLKALELTSQIDQMYFFKKFKNFQIIGTGMTVSGIRQEELLSFLFPLPPLAEQKRIVARIDKLMALCEKLEKQIEQATAKQTDLFDAVLAKV
ncbi:restriction endonuclease subunit S [Alkalispirochaeta alkalica]|uniref:restriction endonuclease subunit S n=1 Tax=Alkalispirochaeta alkalica TaxID=46356 RepID=UPI000365C0B7|nr:restriction endonuclease subunit S [Alkalispirochaeta alkalica]